MHGADLFRAILDPSIPCTAGVMPDVLASFLMGAEGDPDGQWCGIETVGGPLSSGFYAIPFSTHFPLPLLASLSSLAATVITDGTLDGVNAAMNNFPSARPNCYAALAARQQLVASQTVKSRTVSDFAGVWLVLAVGVGLATVVKLGHYGYERHCVHGSGKHGGRRASLTRRVRMSGMGDGDDGGDDDAVQPRTTEDAVRALSDLIRAHNAQLEATRLMHLAQLDHAHALILDTMKHSRAAACGVQLPGQTGEAAHNKFEAAGSSEPAANTHEGP